MNEGKIKQKSRFSILGLLSAAMLVLSAQPILTNSTNASKLLFSGFRADAVASYHLANATHDDYVTAIEEALADKDVELASSIVNLADDESIALPENLKEKVLAAEPDWIDAIANCGTGVLTGEVSDLSSAICTAGAALSPVADVRDLAKEAANYLDGRPVDELIITLSAIGVISTATTLVSLGTSFAAKMGAAFLKAAYKTRKISKGLMKHLGNIAGEAVDMAKFSDAAVIIKTGDMKATGKALSGIIKPQVLSRLSSLGSDLYEIRKSVGIRGAFQALNFAENTKELTRFASIAKKYGKSTLAVFKMVGKVTLTLARVILEVVGWLFALLSWVATALWTTIGFVRSIFRIVL